MASVTYRKKGEVWHIRFRSPGKKELTMSLPGNLYEKTVAKRAGHLSEQIALGRFNPWDSVSPDSVSVDDALEEYLLVHLKNEKWARKTTYRTNKNVLDRMLQPVMLLKLNEVNVKKFQELFNILPGGAYTKKGDRGRLNGFLKWCHEKKYLPERYKVDLPMEYVIEMRNSERVKYLTWDQVHRITMAQNFIQRQNDNGLGRDADFYRDLYWFMFYSLLRKEEIPKLKVKDLTGNKLRVQGKGRRTDSLMLPPPAAKIAQEMAADKNPDDSLFISHMNRPKVHFGRAIDMALGEDHPGGKGFHQLRHGGVVHYLSMGKPVQFVSKLARHKSIQVTLTVYADVLPDQMEQVFSDVEHKPPDH